MLSIDDIFDPQNRIPFSEADFLPNGRFVSFVLSKKQPIQNFAASFKTVSQNSKFRPKFEVILCGKTPPFVRGVLCMSAFR